MYLGVARCATLQGQSCPAGQHVPSTLRIDSHYSGVMVRLSRLTSPRFLGAGAHTCFFFAGNTASVMALTFRTYSLTCLLFPTLIFEINDLKEHENTQSGGRAYRLAP